MENTPFNPGDLVKFREPKSEYEQTATFIVLEDRGPRTAVKDASLMESQHNGTLLQNGWTVYATSDLEKVN